MEEASAHKQASSKIKRVFIRIPVKLPAKILFEGNFYRNIYLDSLSTGGLSFYTKEPDSIPGSFEVFFRVNRYTSPIRVQSEVRNRASVSSGARLGCKFLEISEADKRKITTYICRFLALSLPVRMVMVAASLCTLDALCRVLAYVLYCEAARFEKGFHAPLADYLYFVILLAYLGFSGLALVLCVPITGPKAKSNFIISTGCLIPALIFITARNSVYFKFLFWHFQNLLVNFFFWFYWLFAFFILSTIAIVVLSFDKINQVLVVLDQHRDFLYSEESEKAKA